MDLPALRLDDRFVRLLPGDADPRNRPRQVHNALYSEVRPTPVPEPRVLAASTEVAELLGIRLPLSPELVQAFAGNRVLPGTRPYAACYGGHQFGQWAGQLGDGRAITLGEVEAASGRWEVQLKGAGPTPYSRHADGRAVLRSSVREFLCSEAMHHLGVPTTRALALLGTGEPVVRDMFYDGHPEEEPGAIVVRVAPTFLRLGSYEIHAARRDEVTLRKLVDYTIAEHFPHLAPASPRSIVAMFAEVAERTAVLVAHWQRVGFVHGVMNTDNLSVLGLTIDYGPYGWLEGYDPDWTPNTTDAGARRYRYAHQPAVAGWNLARFAEALVPLVGAVEPFQQALEQYGDWMQKALHITWSGKLGLQLGPADQALLDELFAVLRLVETDFTLFFRALPEVRPADDDENLLAPLSGAFYATPDPAARARIARWVRSWLARAETDAPDPDRRRAAMNAVNPKYVLRNWLAQLAIDRATEGDPAGIDELLDVLRRPYDDQPGREAFADRRPEWARQRAGCSMLSCSS